MSSGAGYTSNNLDSLSLIVLLSNADPTFVVNDTAILPENAAAASAASIAGTSMIIVLGSGNNREVIVHHLMINISAGADECSCEVMYLLLFDAQAQVL